MSSNALAVREINLKSCALTILTKYSADERDEPRLVPVTVQAKRALLAFLPARRYASAGLCDSDVSVRLSVWTSVTRRYCD